VETSDEALLERVARGDHAAFERLVERYRERAYRIAWSMVGNAEDARDLSQDAFIRLYLSAGTFAGRARFSTWFHRILVNLCLDHRRRNHRWRGILGSAMTDGDRTPVLAHEPDRADGPDAAAARTETSDRLWAAVGRLAPQQRAAVVLHLEGLWTGEIAEALGCSDATVRVHLHRALTGLRKTMREA
jgi:RNA polymerase sigma-70 factor, ECF subfamily